MSAIPISLHRSFINLPSGQPIQTSNDFVTVEIKCERLQQLLTEQKLYVEDIHCTSNSSHKLLHKMLLNCLTKSRNK